MQKFLAEKKSLFSGWLGLFPFWLLAIEALQAVAMLTTVHLKPTNVALRAI